MRKLTIDTSKLKRGLDSWWKVKIVKKVLQIEAKVLLSKIACELIEIENKRLILRKKRT